MNIYGLYIHVRQGHSYIYDVKIKNMETGLKRMLYKFQK